MTVWDKLMLQKRAKMCCFHSGDLSQGECLKDGHCAVTSSMARAESPFILSTSIQTFCLLCTGCSFLVYDVLCTLVSEGLWVADTLPLSSAHFCALFVSSVTQRVQYWVQCIRLFFQGDQITPYLSHFPPFQECGDILTCHILETSPFQKSHPGLQSTLNWLLQSGFVLVDFQFPFMTLFFFNCYFSVFSSSIIILFPISFIFILSPHSSFPAVVLAVANSFHLCLL